MNSGPDFTRFFSHTYKPEPKIPARFTTLHSPGQILHKISVRLLETVRFFSFYFKVAIGVIEISSLEKRTEVDATGNLRPS